MFYSRVLQHLGFGEKKIQSPEKHIVGTLIKYYHYHSLNIPDYKNIPPMQCNASPTSVKVPHCDMFSHKGLHKINLTIISVGTIMR